MSKKLSYVTKRGGRGLLRMKVEGLWVRKELVIKMTAFRGKCRMHFMPNISLSIHLSRPGDPTRTTSVKSEH